MFETASTTLPIDQPTGIAASATHSSVLAVGRTVRTGRRTLDGDVVEGATLVLIGCGVQNVADTPVTQDLEVGVHLCPRNQHERALRKLWVRHDEVGIVDRVVAHRK